MNAVSENEIPVRGVRRIRTNARSSTGYVDGQDLESGLEGDFCTLARFDLAVERFVTQPVKIEYVDGKGVLRTYTPDFLLVFHRAVDGIFVTPPELCEIKYQTDFDENAAVYKEKFDAARAYCTRQGWRFKTFSEVQIRTPYLKNAEFLLPYRDRGDEFTPGFLEDVVEWVAANGTATAERLIASRKNSEEGLLAVTAMWHLLSNGVLSCDLNVKITNRTACLARRALSFSLRHKHHFGERVMFDGEAHTVVGWNVDHLILENKSGAFCIADVSSVTRMPKAPAPQRQSLTEQEDELIQALQQRVEDFDEILALPQSERGKAISNYALREGIGRSTVYRQLSAYAEEMTLSSQLRRTRKDKGQHRMSSDVEQIISKSMKKDLIIRTGGSIRGHLKKVIKN